MKYIITSGPMEMEIDSVRKIENSSSGLLGVAIAQELQRKGYNDIVYIHTKGAAVLEGVIKHQINTHLELIEALKQENKGDCTIIHAMAISDYKMGGSISLNELSNLIIDNIAIIKQEEDIKKLIKENTHVVSKLSSSEDQVLLFEKEIKVIDQIKKMNPNAILVGFKLLSNVTTKELLVVGNDIKKRANCDIVVANIKEEVSSVNHKAYIISNDEVVEALTKKEIANKLISILEER